MSTKLIVHGRIIDTRNSKKWKGLILHHSAQKDSLTYNDWASIRKYHTSWRYNYEIITEGKGKELLNSGKIKGVEKPWVDIGYHFGTEYLDVPSTPQKEVVFMIGRALFLSGAHTKGFNEDYLGWCIVGNFDVADIPREVLEHAIIGMKGVLRYFGIKVTPDTVMGHWETFIKLGQARTKQEAWTYHKTCPGRKVDMDWIRQLLRK